MPEASSSLETASRIGPEVSPPSGQAPKRPLDDQLSEEPDARRARLELLCSLCHGHQEQSEENDLRDLVAALKAEPVECVGCSPWPADAAFEEWSAHWWMQEAPNDVEQELGVERVNEAKKQEIRSFKERKVYDVVDRAEYESNSQAIMLSTKWVIVNKGSKSAPVAKARLVAREFVSDRMDKDSLLSCTPGLAAMKLLVSKVASSQGSSRPLRLMLMDIKTAFVWQVQEGQLLSCLSTTKSTITQA